jgi:hypothetical protein
MILMMNWRIISDRDNGELQLASRKRERRSSTLTNALLSTTVYVKALPLFDVWTAESHRPNPRGSRKLGPCAADSVFYDDWTCNISLVGNIGCCITTLLAKRSTVDSDSHTIELHTR